MIAISIAFGAGMIKTGAPARSERKAKCKRLLRSEEEMGKAGGLGGFELRISVTGSEMNCEASQRRCSSVLHFSQYFGL